MGARTGTIGVFVCLWMGMACPLRAGLITPDRLLNSDAHAPLADHSVVPATGDPSLSSRPDSAPAVSTVAATPDAPPALLDGAEPQLMQAVPTDNSSVPPISSASPTVPPGQIQYFALKPASPESVPEPSMLTLIGVLASTLLLRQRRTVRAPDQLRA